MIMLHIYMCTGNYTHFDGGLGKKMSKLKCERRCVGIKIVLM